VQCRPRGSSEAKQRERVVTVIQRINYYPRIGNKVSSLELDFAARQTNQPICLATCHSHVRGGIVGSPRVHQGHKDQSLRQLNRYSDVNAIPQYTENISGRANKKSKKSYRHVAKVAIDVCAMLVDLVFWKIRIGVP
jgi:hypothetical protein